MKENEKSFDYTFKPKAHSEYVDVEDLNIIEKHYIFKNEKFIEVQKNGDKFELKRVKDGIELSHFKSNDEIEKTLVFEIEGKFSPAEEKLWEVSIGDNGCEQLIGPGKEVIAEGFFFGYGTFFLNEMTPGGSIEIIYKDDLTKEYCGEWGYGFDNGDILVKEQGNESWLLFSSETRKVFEIKKEELNELVEIYWATMNKLCEAGVDHGYVAVVEEMRNNGNFTEEWVVEILDELVG